MKNLLYRFLIINDKSSAQLQIWTHGAAREYHETPYDETPYAFLVIFRFTKQFDQLSSCVHQFWRPEFISTQSN